MLVVDVVVIINAVLVLIVLVLIVDVVVYIVVVAVIAVVIDVVIAASETQYRHSILVRLVSIDTLGGTSLFLDRKAR